MNSFELYTESIGIIHVLNVENEGKRMQECLLGFGLSKWVDSDAIY